MTRRTVDAQLLRGMTFNSAKGACLRRGMTPGGRWRYEGDVSAVIRKLDKMGVLSRINRLEWSVVEDIAPRVSKVIKDISRPASTGRTKQREIR